MTEKFIVKAGKRKRNISLWPSCYNGTPPLWPYRKPVLLYLIYRKVRNKIPTRPIQSAAITPTAKGQKFPALKPT
jgi:hypothetical protein